MAMFIEDTKNKNEDDLLFINLVSNEKISNENDQGPATNVPLGDDDLGLTIIHVPKEDQSEPEPKSDVQEEEEENDDDFEPLPNGARARVSTRPSKRPAPSPKTN
ncbi:uncharacterized protein LOC129871143 [Solanum dulcamara]|uniref:uncharacterized protein LOC129871143 n=1 Tax=Solanum dulcamara TaxID=45834 RepID=UPI00248613EF|nr:uncharacterized protein LOC129871143 [Solanum dulcamara]